MTVCVYYLNSLEQPTTVSGTSLLIAGNALRLIREHEAGKTETPLFSYDTFWLIPDENSIISDSAKTQTQIGVRSDDGSLLSLTDEQGTVISESRGFQVQTLSDSLELVDDGDQVIALWLYSSQSWWQGGVDVGLRLRIGLPGPDWATFVPLVRERPSSLAERALAC